MTVARRSFLGSLVAAAGLGAAGYHFVQPAAANTHSGEIGTQTDLARIWAEQIRDDNDNTAFDVTGSGVTVSQDLNLGSSQSINNASLIGTDGVNYNSLTPDYRLSSYNGAQEDSDQTTTNTNYSGSELQYEGAVDLASIPKNATLYGRFFARLKNDTSNETTSAQPRIFDDGGGNWQDLTSLEVSVTATSFNFVDSGWTDISGDITNLSNLHRAPNIELKVSGGTGTIQPTNTELHLAASE